MQKVIWIGLKQIISEFAGTIHLMEKPKASIIRLL